MEPATVHPSLREAVAFWARLGFISFGGPSGQIAILHRETVEKKKWIDDAMFGRALAFCAFLPGPEAQQLATWVGWRLHGWRGALAAGILFVAPAALLLVGLSYIRAAFGTIPVVTAVLWGLRPVVAAIILDACWSMGNRRLKSAVDRIVAGLALSAAMIGVPFPLTVAAAALVGVLGARAADDVQSSGDAEAGPPRPFRRASLILLCGALLWAMPWPFVATSTSLEFFERLYLFFTQAAFVTFGGAYAVLSYVSQKAVEDFGWLSQLELMDGLALAETTPGPLIIVLQYIGFFAGWNHAACAQTRFSCGVVAATLTTWATFLPSIGLVLLGAPYVGRLTAMPRVGSAFRSIAAAVTGVVLGLGLTFSCAVILPGSVAQAGARADIAAGLCLVTAFFALRFGRVPMGIVIVTGALVGCATAFP
jgi:chromate transporter